MLIPWLLIKIERMILGWVWLCLIKYWVFCANEFLNLTICVFIRELCWPKMRQKLATVAIFTVRRFPGFLETWLFNTCANIVILPKQHCSNSGREIKCSSYSSPVLAKLVTHSWFEFPTVISVDIAVPCSVRRDINSHCATVQCNAIGTNFQRSLIRSGEQPPERHPS